MGEFRELGFEVSFRLSESVADADLEKFWDLFIGEAIEAHALMCGGGCGRVWDVFVTCPGRRSATEQNRREIAEWFQRRPEVLDVRIGQLIDAWHSDFTGS